MYSIYYSCYITIFWIVIYLSYLMNFTEVVMHQQPSISRQMIYQQIYLEGCLWSQVLTVDSAKLQHWLWPTKVLLQFRHTPLLCLCTYLLWWTSNKNFKLEALFYFILTFDFCRFHMVIHFFPPCHNGQWPPTSKDFLSQILSITFIFLS